MPGLRSMRHGRAVERFCGTENQKVNYSIDVVKRHLMLDTWQAITTMNLHAIYDNSKSPGSE
jgi:hypothetical protein